MIVLRRFVVPLALAAALALFAAACAGSGSPAASEGDASSAVSSEPSPADSTAPESSAPDASIDVNIGGNLPDGFDQKLVPPSSTVASSITTPDGQLVVFHSDASYDELKSFYESAIASLGGETFKAEAGGSLQIAWGDGSAGTGGLVIVAPSVGGSGFEVSVTYAVSA